MIIVRFAPFVLLFACFSLLACAAQVTEVKIYDKTNIDYVELLKVEGASLRGMEYTFDRALVKIHGTAKNGEGKKDANGGVAEVGFTKSAVIVGMKLRGTGTAPEVTAGTRIEFSDALKLDSFSVIGDDRAYVPRPVTGTKYNMKSGVIFVDADLVGDDYKAFFDRYTSPMSKFGIKKGDIRSLIIEFNGLVPVYFFAYTPDGYEHGEWVLTDRIDVALGSDLTFIEKPDPKVLALHIIRKIEPGNVPSLHTHQVVNGYDLESYDIFGAISYGSQLRFGSLPDYTNYATTSRTAATGSTDNPLKELPSSKQRALQIGDTRVIRSGIGVRRVSFGGGSVFVTLSGVGKDDDMRVLLAKTVTRSPEFDLIEAVADYYGDAQYKYCMDQLMGSKSLLDFARNDPLTTDGVVRGAPKSALASNKPKQCSTPYWNILMDCVGKKTLLSGGALAFELSPRANGEYWAQYRSLQPVAEYFSGPNIYELQVYANGRRVVDGVYLALQDLNPDVAAKVAAHGEGSAHTYLAYAGQLMPTTDGVMMLDCSARGDCTLSVGENVFAELTSAAQTGTLLESENGEGHAMITAFDAGGRFEAYAPVGRLGTKKLSCIGGAVTETRNGNCFLITVGA